jgi:hypothetical protein
MIRTSIWIEAILLLTGFGSAAAQSRIITGKVTDSLSAEVVTSGQVSVQGSTVRTVIAGRRLGAVHIGRYPGRSHHDQSAHPTREDVDVAAGAPRLGEHV